MPNAPFAPAQNALAEFVAIPVSMLFPSRVMGVPLYLFNDNGEVVLYRSANYPFTAADIDKLVDKGVDKLYVAFSDRDAYQQQLRANLDETLASENVAVPVRMGMLDEVVRSLLSESFARPDVQLAVETAATLGKTTVSFICHHDVVASELIRVLRHDYHTFNHSANVSYYCVLLAHRMGIANHEELEAIATGALLHDLGKLEIPDSILAKPGRLTDREFRVVQAHPGIGFRKLSRRSDLSYGQLMMVYQHHERVDGRGYPVGVHADEIHDWAKLCGVVDVFEALTSDRPYRAGMPISKAFELMRRFPEFDPDMLQCWIKTFARSSPNC